jgi:hypothetical protein
MPWIVLWGPQALFRLSANCPIVLGMLLTASFKELIVHIERDQWYRQPAEVVLHRRGDRVYVQIWVRDIVVVVGLEAAADLVDL